MEYGPKDIFTATDYARNRRLELFRTFFRQAGVPVIAVQMSAGTNARIAGTEACLRPQGRADNLRYSSFILVAIWRSGGVIWFHTAVRSFSRI